MSRERLPPRRQTETIEIIHKTPQGDEQSLTLSIGRQTDGRIAEVFVEVPYQQRKFATALLGKDLATLVSISLQHGAELSELNAAMGRSAVNRLGKMVEMPHTILGTILDELERADGGGGAGGTGEGVGGPGEALD